MDMRVGFGYDVHQWASDRPLVLGGIRIPHHQGLLGHSDADVLLHAITDALLGALALGDIGTHFPDTNPEYKGADSGVLLQKAYALIREKGYMIVNIDATVIMEKPKLLEYIPKITQRISELLDTELDRVSIKATTSEKMGFVGRGEGAASMATVLVQQEKKDN